MKMDFLLKRPSLFLLLAVGLAFLLVNCPGTSDPLPSVGAKTELKQTTDRKGQALAVREVKANDKSDFSESEITALSKRLGTAEKNLKLIIDVNAKLKEKLVYNGQKIDSLNNTISLYTNNKDNKPEKSTIEVAVNETTKEAEIKADIKVNITQEHERGGLFKKGRDYIKLSSPDNNITFHGLKFYEKDILPKRKNFAVVAGGFVTAGESFKPLPFVGAGIGYKIAEF